MRDRFTALHNPKAEIVLFLEFIPQTIAAWIKNQYVLGVENFKRALIFTEKNLNLTIAFMKDHGLIHFDTQQTLFQTAKMTSLGEMAGGIAHEINTPLAIILSATHQIETYLGVAPPNIEKSLYKLQKIESTVKRISQIVRGLRTFSRNSKDDGWEQCSLRQIISDTIALCNEKFSALAIKIEIKESDDFQVNCVPTQISQIILNLLNNAHDAVIELPEKWISVELELIDKNVCVRIIDSGKGLQSNVASKIMQPFFTTKQVGKGTGLGLSISKGLAESFNGSLSYKLHHGHTSFTLALPVSLPTAKLEAA